MQNMPQQFYLFSLRYKTQKHNNTKILTTKLKKKIHNIKIQSAVQNAKAVSTFQVEVENTKKSYENKKSANCGQNSNNCCTIIW